MDLSEQTIEQLVRDRIESRLVLRLALTNDRERDILTTTTTIATTLVCHKHDGNQIERFFGASTGHDRTTGGGGGVTLALLILGQERGGVLGAASHFEQLLLALYGH